MWGSGERVLLPLGHAVLSRWLPLCCCSWRRKMPSGWCALSSRNWFLPPTSAPPWWVCRLTSVSCDSSLCSTCPAWTSCSRSTTLVKVCPTNHSFSCQDDMQTKVTGFVSQRECSRARSKTCWPWRQCLVIFELEGEQLGESIFTSSLSSFVTFLFCVFTHRALLDHLALVPHLLR